MERTCVYWVWVYVLFLFAVACGTAGKPDRVSDVASQKADGNVAHPWVVADALNPRRLPQFEVSFPTKQLPSDSPAEVRRACS